MKKSLLALAVLGAFAGTASAQSSVTIYGIADMGINYDNGRSNVTPGNVGKKWSLASGQQSGSRIGFKGTEDLGGGLAAVFTLENGFNADDGTLGNSGRLFGRQAWVGLNGGFGSVKLGRQYSSTYLALQTIDPCGIANACDGQRVFAYGLGKVDPISRSDNTITYTSPSFGGVTALVGYGFGEQAGAFSNGSNTFAGLSYVAGPVNVQASYQKVNTLTLKTTDANGLVTGTATTGLTGGIATGDVKTAFLGATYDFGVAKAHLGFGDTKLDSGAADTKIRNYLVGVSAPVGVGSVFASWNRNDFRDQNEGASNQYGIGYSHPLSKRTNLYTSFGYTKNDDRVRLNAANVGGNDREFQAGIRHTF